MTNADFAEWLKEIAATAKDRPPTMALFISEEGQSVSLILDSSKAYYGEWIKGEGGDICLYRDRETKKVVGCHLPLYQRRLAVDCGGTQLVVDMPSAAVVPP